jgi:hypothetical protein
MLKKSYLNNNIYFEFQLFLFYIKDLNTKAILFSGQSKDGLYILFESFAISIHQVYWSSYVSASVDLCHRQLGHPTSYFFNFLV